MLPSKKYFLRVQISENTEVNIEKHNYTIEKKINFFHAILTIKNIRKMSAILNRVSFSLFFISVSFNSYVKDLKINRGFRSLTEFLVYFQKLP